jgi:excinuclease UvrABC nuclease subunit
MGYRGAYRNMLRAHRRFIESFPSMSPEPSRVSSVPTVYCLMDADGNTLYVGSTNNMQSRLTSHRRQKYWWGEVASIELVECESMSAARALELETIRERQPAYNINGKS